MTPTEKRHYAQMYAALQRIRSYQSPDHMRRHSARDWGLDDANEAIKYAYDNVLQEAKKGLRGVRRVQPNNPMLPSVGRMLDEARHKVLEEHDVLVARGEAEPL